MRAARDRSGWVGPRSTAISSFRAQPPVTLRLRADRTLVGGRYPYGVLVACVEMATSTPTTRGYSATKSQLDDRLARIEGQVRGVRRMVEDDRYCIDVLTQISAVQAALDKVALGLLDDHARHCVMGADATDQKDRAGELMRAVGRLMSRR